MERQKRFLSGRLAVGLLLGLAASGLWAAGPSSPSYILQQSSLNGGGKTSSSSGYRLEASFAQPATVGTSSAAPYVLQSGFWSFVGSGLVPVVLSVNRNTVDPEDIDLDWSGNDDPFEIYRSTDCASVLSSFFVQTAGNSYTDTSPPSVNLLCYSVLPSAPGPVPPPQGSP